MKSGRLSVATRTNADSGRLCVAALVKSTPLSWATRAPIVVSNLGSPYLRTMLLPSSTPMDGEPIKRFCLPTNIG
jgi:hypothetical protein